MGPDPRDTGSSANRPNDSDHFDPASQAVAEKIKLWENSRRQFVVRQLLAAPQRQLTLRELAQELRDTIDERTNQSPDYDNVRQVLRRRHLPALAEHDVIVMSENLVQPGPEFITAIEVLLQYDPYL